MSAPLTTRRRKEIASLVHKKYRDRRGEMLVEGVRSVEAAVTAGAPVAEILVTEAAYAGPRTRALLQKVRSPIHVLSEHDFATCSDVQTSQGVLAVVHTVVFPIERLPTCSTVLLLDGVQDPGNVGTLIRTAAWFGVEAIVGGPGTADFFGPKVVRAAMGGLWDVYLARVKRPDVLLASLRRQGLACYGADLEGTAIAAWQPRSPAALVIGSEAHGLSVDVLAQLDGRVLIGGAASRESTESLNVAVAAGILLYEWLGKG